MAPSRLKRCASVVAVASAADAQSDRDDRPERPIRWVKLARYCQLTGDTRDAVYSKRSRRIWVDGQHCKMAPDGALWVNLEEVEKWVEQDRDETTR